MIQHLEETVYITAKEICKYAEDQYGVCFTSIGMTNLLHRLGFSYRKPKHVPRKTKALAQETFLEKYQKLNQAKGPKEQIYFVDGVHPLHNSQPAFGWLKKGHDYIIESNTGRSRVNINGACNLEEQKVVIEESSSINTNSTMALFNKIL